MKITVLFLLIALLAISGYARGQVDEQELDVTGGEEPSGELDEEGRELWQPWQPWYYKRHRSSDDDDDSSSDDDDDSSSDDDDDSSSDDDDDSSSDDDDDSSSDDDDDSSKDDDDDSSKDDDDDSSGGSGGRSKCRNARKRYQRCKRRRGKKHCRSQYREKQRKC